MPPFRSPSWKGGPSTPSSYHRSPQERQVAGPRKRRISDTSMPSSDPALEHGNPKQARRERPQLLSLPRPFGGKPLSLRDKSHLVKSRQIRAESLMRLRIPPSVKPRPQLGDPISRGNVSSALAIRKKRFQSNPVPLQKLEARRARPQQSSPKEEANVSRSSRTSDTGKEQVDSRRSLNTHRYGIFLLPLFAGAWWWLGGQERMSLCERGASCGQWRYDGLNMQLWFSWGNATKVFKCLPLCVLRN